MDKTKKLIIIIAIIVFIMLIACVIAIVLVDNETDSTEGTIKENEDGTDEYFPEADLSVEYYQEELNDPTEFFSVEQAIQNYFDENFIAKKMNFLQGDRIMTYSAYGKITSEDSSDVSEKYFIVRVDVYNLTCEIEELNENQYEDIDQINLEDDETEIISNGNNSFEYVQVSNEDMCRKYLEDFVEKEFSNPEEAYSIIDEEYKNIRFPTFEDYQEYLEEYQDILQGAVLSEYSVEIKDEYREYTLVDNYDNTYIVKAKGVMDYTILLDNYTIKVDTYEENYSNLSDEQKVQANAYIFLQMINTKDYSHAYAQLDETFRNNNFATLDEFKEYVNNNFFTYNLAITSSADINVEGNTYIYEIPIRSGSGSAAEEKELTIIMQLLEGTDFVMSFSID